MQRLPFTKMHGLGNSYIYINAIETDMTGVDLAELAQQISNVNTGIGSDGLILIAPSEIADVKMIMYNKDGSEGKTCGNGLRCVAKYSYENQLVTSKTFAIETKAGLVDAEVSFIEDQVDVVTINMGEPLLNRSQIPMLGKEQEKIVNEPFQIGDQLLQLTAVSMGNPHAIFFVEDINAAPLYEFGPIITNDSRFPEGVNVEFVEIVNEREMNFRVWERGSGVTQACGTGACAATVAAILNGYAPKNEAVTVHLDGGDLEIRLDQHNQVWMTGAAEVTATGTYQLNR